MKTVNGLETTAEGVVANIKVIPRASRNEVCGLFDGAIKIRLQAPPVENKANKALLRFLAAHVGVPPRNLDILAGDKCRQKRVLIRGITESDFVLPS